MTFDATQTMWPVTRTVWTVRVTWSMNSAGHMPEGTLMAVITVIFSKGQPPKPWVLFTG
jgi:hypothetical protein